MTVQEQLDQASEERAVLKAAHRRSQIVNGVLYGLSFLSLVLSVAIGTYLYSALQDNRKGRVIENAQSELISCSRSNYQDVRDRLQDQVLLDFMTASGVGKSGTPGQDAFLKAAKDELGFRLENQPPSVATLLKRWRGNPVSEQVLKQRQMDAAGPQARAQARDRGDFIKPPVNCDELPSQRPFTR